MEQEHGAGEASAPQTPNEGATSQEEPTFRWGDLSEIQQKFFAILAHGPEYDGTPIQLFVWGSKQLAQLIAGGTRAKSWNEFFQNNGYDIRRIWKKAGWDFFGMGVDALYEAFGNVDSLYVAAEQYLKDEKQAQDTKVIEAL